MQLNLGLKKEKYFSLYSLRYALMLCCFSILLKGWILFHYFIFFVVLLLD